MGTTFAMVNYNRVAFEGKQLLPNVEDPPKSQENNSHSLICHVLSYLSRNLGQSFHTVGSKITDFSVTKSLDTSDIMSENQ
jgi:hypothetical protein